MINYLCCSNLIDAVLLSTEAHPNRPGGAPSIIFMGMLRIFYSPRPTQKHNVQDPRRGSCKSTDHRTRAIPDVNSCVPANHETGGKRLAPRKLRSLICLRRLTRVASGGASAIGSTNSPKHWNQRKRPRFQGNLVFNGAASGSKIPR